MRKVAFALFLALSLPAFGSSGFSSRPLIEDIKPAKNVARFRLNDEPMLNAKLRFLAQILAFFPKHELFFLARDCDYLYDIIRLLKAGDDALLKRIHLIAVSRPVAEDPKLEKYLIQRKLFTLTSQMPALLIDQGFEGSIPNAIWDVAEEHSARKIDAFFISSVHPKIASSRVASVPYAVKLKKNHDDASGELVDDLEGLPHYFPTSATAIERVKGAWDVTVADSEKDLADNPVRAQALEYMAKLRALAKQDEFVHAFRLYYEALNGVYLAIHGEVSATEVRERVTYATKLLGNEVLQDVRELYWKGHIEVTPEQMATFWRRVGGAPEVPDLYEDVVDNKHDDDPASEDWLIDGQWEESARLVLERNKKTLREAFKLTIPPLWAELVKQVPQKRLKELHDIARETGRDWELGLTDEPLTMQVVEKILRNAHYPGYEAELRWDQHFKKDWFNYSGEWWPRAAAIAEGTHGDVELFNKAGHPQLIVKHPAEPEDVAYFTIERRVYDDLINRAPGVGVLPIEEVGEGDFYFIKKHVDPRLHGPAILTNGLSLLQEQRLKEIFEAACDYARLTGIGLDLKAENLAWVGERWVLLEAGPRINHRRMGYTLDRANFAEYLKIWHLDDLPSKEDEGRTPQPKQEASPFRVVDAAYAQTLAQDAPWYKTAPSTRFAKQKIESLIELEEFPDAELIHSVAYAQFAQDEGRIKTRLDPKDLEEGTFTFVLLTDGTWIFGRDENGLEIGVKHFQLAQGSHVVAAGEYSRDKFSLMSGSFSRDLLKNRNYDEAKTARHVAKMFQDEYGKKVKFVDHTLINKPKTVSVAALRRYCADEHFRVLHSETICKKWSADEACPSRLLTLK